MVPSIARQSVILKCNMQKSVMLGNYEFFYAAGLMRKLYNIEIRTDMEPEQILEAILQMQDNLAPQSEQEKYLIQIIKNYEPSADHDAQMDELFAWGEQEPALHGRHGRAPGHQLPLPDVLVCHPLP